MRTCNGWQKVILLDGALLLAEDYLMWTGQKLGFTPENWQRVLDQEELARTDNPKAIAARSAEE